MIFRIRPCRRVSRPREREEHEYTGRMEGDEEKRRRKSAAAEAGEGEPRISRSGSKEAGGRTGDEA